MASKADNMINNLDVDNQDNDDSEYEEVYVYVGFPDFDDLQLLSASTIIELSGLEGDSPVCKINNVTFKGEHQTNLGTQLFFDSVIDEPPTLYAKTDNCISFKFQSVDVEGEGDHQTTTDPRTDHVTSQSASVQFASTNTAINEDDSFVQATE